MKGFLTQYGYMGWVINRWMIFATEDEYVEYIRELDEGNK